jgi:hypothetical protein
MFARMEGLSRRCRSLGGRILANAICENAKHENAAVNFRVTFTLGIS